jgi:hypothetical protein
LYPARLGTRLPISAFSRFKAEQRTKAGQNLKGGPECEPDRAYVNGFPGSRVLRLTERSLLGFYQS